MEKVQVAPITFVILHQMGDAGRGKRPLTGWFRCVGESDGNLISLSVNICNKR